MSNPSSPKATLHFREFTNGLPFEASLTEAKNGGDEVGGVEDLEVALGCVMAFGAVDDGFSGGVPGDLLEGGVFAKATTPREGMAAGGIPPNACDRRCRGRGRVVLRRCGY